MFFVFFLPGYSSELHLEADALYWKANQSGLFFALEDRKGKDTVLNEPRFEWSLGYKLGLGYFLSSLNWDVVLRLTHLNTHADSLLHAKVDRELYPIWITTPLSAYAIKMHWRLHLGFLDALAAKSIRAKAHFILYPQWGLRYALVRQKFNLEYRAAMSASETEEDLSMKNKFSGIGPYAALGMQWELLRYFTLSANVGLSAPYGEFYLHQAEDLANGHVKIFSIRNTLTRLVLIADTSLVLRWQTVWEKSQRILSLQIGCDAVLLFKQNRLIHFFESSVRENGGNLGLKGGQVGFRLDF